MVSEWTSDFGFKVAVFDPWGVSSCSWSPRLQIRVADGRLMVGATGGWSILDFDRGQPTPVTALSKDEFYEGDDHTRIAFTRDAVGKVIGAVLNPGRWEQRGALVQ